MSYRRAIHKVCIRPPVGECSGIENGHSRCGGKIDTSSMDGNLDLLGPKSLEISFEQTALDKKSWDFSVRP